MQITLPGSTPSCLTRPRPRSPPPPHGGCWPRSHPREHRDCRGRCRPNLRPSSCSSPLAVAHPSSASWNISQTSRPLTPSWLQVKSKIKSNQKSNTKISFPHNLLPGSGGAAGSAAEEGWLSWLRVSGVASWPPAAGAAASPGPLTSPPAGAWASSGTEESLASRMAARGHWRQRPVLKVSMTFRGSFHNILRRGLIITNANGCFVYQRLPIQLWFSAFHFSKDP